MKLEEVRAGLLALQHRIVRSLENLDGQCFVRDVWRRAPDDPLRGDGVSCLLEGGALIERGGVGFSHVQGDALPNSATVTRPQLAGHAFEALGLSAVLHPENPYCPTAHLNVRLLIATPRAAATASPVFWFGGALDLTPYYGFEDDARHFHRTCRDALAPFGETLYPRFKQACDAYFFLKHRNEPRGIGGIFYDDFSELGFEQGCAMMQNVGMAFLDAYLPIIEARRHLAFGARERTFQAYRRGRYVEFNLLFDRGTLFGLQSGGRTESILMSLPPVAHWRYDWTPEPDSPEAQLYRDFLRPRNWLESGPVVRQPGTVAKTV